MQIPTEIYDAIASYVEKADVSDNSKNGTRRYVLLGGDEARRNLGALRLVNKSFCFAASPRLFRHVVAIIPSQRLLDISNIPNAVYVKQVDFRFQSYKEPIIYQPHEIDVEGFTRLLPYVLAKFPNISALEFLGPPSSIPQLQKKSYISTVVTALRYIPLAKLTELEITFPIAYNFGHFFTNDTKLSQIPIERVLKNLRHLGLHVSEWTNGWGQRYSPIHVLPENDDLPNELHATHLCKLVELAESLHSLKICSTNPLSLDTIQFRHSLHLEFLDLKGVSISSHNLLSLIQRSSESIQMAKFTLVLLESGTWKDILSRMCALPQLTDFFINSSGYSPTGTSSGFFPSILPPEWDPREIETTNDLDNYALGDLQRQVNINRIAAGHPPFGKDEYRYLERAALENYLRSTTLEGLES